MDGGFNTVESVAYTYDVNLVALKLALTAVIRPRRVLEQIKGISEQKAAKILAEGRLYSLC